jgi:hypothetical protein
VGTLSAASARSAHDDPCYETAPVLASGRVTAMLVTDNRVWVACANGLVDVYAGSVRARVCVADADLLTAQPTRMRA